MADLPRKQTFVTTRHEWVIGEPEGRPIDAKTFNIGMAAAQRGMQEYGVDLSWDDAYRVRGNEDGTVTLFVEIESSVDPVRPAQPVSLDADVALQRPLSIVEPAPTGGDVA